MTMSADSTPSYTAGPRFFIITHDDLRGTVMVVTIIFGIYAYMILSIRLAVRRRAIGVDDFLAVLATVSEQLLETSRDLTIPDTRHHTARSSNRCYFSPFWRIIRVLH